jgi:hypothetical protein
MFPSMKEEKFGLTPSNFLTFHFSRKGFTSTESRLLTLTTFAGPS